MGHLVVRDSSMGHLVRRDSSMGNLEGEDLIRGTRGENSYVRHLVSSVHLVGKCMLANLVWTKLICGTVGCLECHLWDSNL